MFASSFALYWRLKAAQRERKKSKERSPKWSAVRDAHLRLEPECAACGGQKFLQVHHKEPFHLHPELELQERNLITLCMGKWVCHLKLGHGGDFDCRNPTIVSDAKAFRYADDARRKAITNLARTGRLKDGS